MPEMRRLEGKVAIVTGAAQGIGAGIAERLAEEGALVACADLNLEEAQSTAAGLDGAAAVHLDVTSEQSWAKAVGEIEEELGQPLVLVNNAGIARDRTILNLAVEDWDAVLDVHLRGCFYACRAVLPSMREANWGRIVNISSTSHLGNFGQVNYAAAKAGINGLTAGLALETAKRNILVNAVAPHLVDTPMARSAPEEFQKMWQENVPVKRWSQPSEIAAAVAFLASDDASYITGQVLHVCGGATLGA